MADDQPTHQTSRWALCPQCGRFPERTTEYYERATTVWTAVHLCVKRHQWLTKWLPGEVVA